MPQAERPHLFWRSEPFLATSCWLNLTGDLNAVLDHDIDRTEPISDTNNPDMKPFRDFIDKFDLFDKYGNEHPGI